MNKKEERTIYNGELEGMRQVMAETKIKPPDHICNNVFMRWAFDNDLKWYDCNLDDNKERFKVVYVSWVEAWKTAKDINWKDIERINK